MPSILALKEQFYVFSFSFIYSNSGLISVDVQLVGGKMPERDVTLMKECLEATILMVWNRACN